MITNFEKFGFTPKLLWGIVKMGYYDPSPVQEVAIGPMLEKQGLLVQALIGTGETAAFGLPILESVNPTDRQIQAVVLYPTRELAVQATGVLKQMATYKQGIRVLTLYDGEPIQRQIMALKRCPQTIVATPGRMMDHVRRRTTRLSGVSCIVPDEADQILDMGFREDIHTILQCVPTERQTVLFSATLSNEVKTIAAQYQQDTKRICVQPNTASTKEVGQFYYEVRDNTKSSALLQLLQKKQFDLSLVLVATKVIAGGLASQLTETRCPAEVVHGDLRQKQRDQIMRRYRDDKVDILVAIGVAARGIDIGGIDAVVNCDILGDAESYVRRIGRTGWADRTGIAYTFIYPRERGKLHEIISSIKAPITPVILDTKFTLPEFSMLQKQYQNENRNKRKNTGKPWNGSRSPHRPAFKA